MINELLIITRSGKLIHYKSFSGESILERSQSTLSDETLSLVSGAIVALVIFGEKVYNKELEQVKIEEKMLHIAEGRNVIICIVTDGPIISALFLARKYVKILDEKLEVCEKESNVNKVESIVKDDIHNLEKEIIELNKRIAKTEYI
ncbi:MAG: hypothetical protein ACP6IS_12695 [Candidatus Asgardarchaeia archaeon]